jgi:hypothetical protein
MFNTSRRFSIIFFGIATLLSAGGRIVYHDDSKLVIDCDDNRTSLVLQRDKDTDGFRYKDKHYTNIEEIIEAECQ